MDPRDFLSLARPRQWTKNLAVLAALIFSGNLLDRQLVGVSLLAFVSMCAVSSAVYAANDVADATRDQQHVRKRERPVASGRVTRGQATAFALTLLLTGMTLGAVIGPRFLALAAMYVVVQLLYSVWLKHVAIVDMLTIASGFVIRAVAGALAIEVPVSPWLVLCAGLLALFLATAKRRHELVLLRGQSPEHRPVLSEYSAELLDSFMVTLSAATVSAYALYTFFEERAPADTMMLTIPFVIYGVLRYQTLVLHRGRGGSPEDILLGDRALLTAIALWGLACIIVLYLAPRLIAN